MDELESKLKDAFKAIDGLRTSACLDTKTIGLYAEDKLSKEERTKAEHHIDACLYCLDQLSEMKELLFLKRQETEVSPALLAKIKDLYPKQAKKNASHKNILSFIFKIGDFLSYPVKQWRYSVVSLVSVCMTLLIGFALLKSDKTFVVSPKVDLNSFVNVRSIGNRGQILSEAQGVVVNSKGLIASNLSPLAGARAVQVVLRDGTTYFTRNIWKDDDKNLAVMKIDNEKLPSIPLADVKQMSVGESAFILVDPAGSKNRFKEAVISDFKPFAGRNKGEELQYIQLATLTSTLTRGALVDKDGKLIGLILTAEKNINLAVPLQNIEKMVQEHQAIPVSELKNVKFSAEALNLYMQGILTRDAQSWDKAIHFFQQAVALNPNLEGAHLELGYLYYRKHLYDLEGKEYQEALRINPNNTDAIYSLATNLETRGFYEEAIKEYQKVIAIDTEDAESYYNLGVAYVAEGQKNRAMEIYTKLKNLDPGNAEMLRRLIK